MEQTVTEALATPDEMAEVYQVTRTTMYRWLNEGRVPGAFKVGNKWRVSLPEWRAAVAGVRVND
jgi:excisionase family DNA binding protein